MAEQNRSLIRGIEILKTFKPGIDLLGNGDIAERTGLSKSTVSRLTQTLVTTGMLEHDRKQRGYRLAPPVLSLAFALKSSSPILSAAAPKMRIYAEKFKVNIGLASADRDEMVYLESIRYSNRIAFRNVVSGLRVPMELTSLGRAWLAMQEPTKRQELYELFKSKRNHDWRKIKEEILQAIEDVQSQDFCHARWQPGVFAISTPIQYQNSTQHVLNLSISLVDEEPEIKKLSDHLLSLKEEILKSDANPKREITDQ